MERLKKIMNGVLGVKEEDVNDDMSTKKVEDWDSLRHMCLIVAIEEAYKVKLTAEDIVHMVNVKEIKRVLRDRGVVI